MCKRQRHFSGAADMPTYHRNETLVRACALVVVCAVAIILGISFVAYVGERIVGLATTAQRAVP